MISQGSHRCSARVRRTALLVALVACVGPSKAQGQSSPIPDELRMLVAACRDNTRRIDTLQLTGTMTLSGALYQGQWDPITGDTSDSQTRVFTLWKDPLRWRFDVTADRETSPQGEVIYKLPYGEHITSYAKIEREGGLDALKRQYGTPLSTTRSIVSPDGGLRYRPESNTVELNVPYENLALVDEQPDLQLALSKVLLGRTLAEFVDRWTELPVEGNRRVEVERVGETQYRLRFVFVEPPTPTGSSVHTRDVFVDLDKGGSVLSYVDRTDARVVSTGEFDYISVEDTWVLSHAVVTRTPGPDGPPGFATVYDIAPESLRVNEPIEPRIFTFEGLEVRKGALVFDHKTREEFLYDDIPLHLKVALAMAREAEEEAAEAAALATPAAPPPATAEPRPQPSPTDTEQPSTPTIASTAREAKPSAERMAAEPTDRVETPQTGTSTPLPPESRPTATRPAATRPSARPPLPEAEPAAADDAAAAAAGPTERQTPTHTATVVAVSAGCVAALGIGLWKVTRRGARLPK